MKKKFGKMEASHIGKNNSVIMIVCIFAITLFIGTAVQPAIASALTDHRFETQKAEEGCPLCAPRADVPSSNPTCKTCGEAVTYAVDYMKVYVKNKLKDVNETYFLWTLDVVLLISQGIHIGLQKSGFKIEVDKEELNDNIVYWVNKTVGPQMFNVTMFLAKLGAISIGVSSYLLTLCNDGTSKNSKEILKQKWSIFGIVPRILRWIRMINFKTQ
jgi:hypothetical protein